MNIDALLQLAREHALPALQIRCTQTMPNIRRGLSPIVTVSLQATRELHSANGDVQAIELSVDGAWLRRPLPRQQHSVHRVRPTSMAGQVTPIARFSGCDGTTAHRTESLPTAYDLARAGHTLERDDALDLDDYIFNIDEERGPLHQFMGYAAPIQGDVWQSLRSDLAAENNHEALESLDKEDYRLLFQLESDAVIGLDIADGGRLYVLMSTSDLSAGRFDRTLACVQSS